METGLFFRFFSKCLEKTVDICPSNVLTSEETNFLPRNPSSFVPWKLNIQVGRYVTVWRATQKVRQDSVHRTSENSNCTYQIAIGKATTSYMGQWYFSTELAENPAEVWTYEFGKQPSAYDFPSRKGMHIGVLRTNKCAFYIIGHIRYVPLQRHHIP